MTNPNIIDRTVVNNKYVVSTVLLLGAAHLYDLMGRDEFETMVFPCDEQGNVTNWRELDCRRYHSVEAARDGHNDVVLDFLTK